MKVLVIEDERKVVDYLRSGLTEQGWIVDVAMDGEEGAWMATEYDFDVIVLDVMLPKARRLRRAAGAARAQGHAGHHADRARSRR